MNNVDMAMSQLAREIEDRMSVVREKERRLMELEKAIGETEKSYDIVAIGVFRSFRPRGSYRVRWRIRQFILRIWAGNDRLDLYSDKTKHKKKS